MALQAPELTAGELSQFTRNRLKADDPETERLLVSALAAARSACEWHVTPVKVDHVVTLDGPGTRRLILPTRKLVGPPEVTESGTAIDTTRLSFSERGVVTKKSGGCWSGEYGAITVKMTHGFEPDDAADWRQAVLEIADQMAISVQRGDRSIIRKRVDDVEIYWSDKVVEDLKANPLLEPYRRYWVV